MLIASPTDTIEARGVVERTVASWNRDRSSAQRVVLLAARWETDAVPELGGSAQAAINRQLVDDADIVVALFHTRLGAPTERAESGTAEEIERAADRGVPVHVFFSEMPIPRDVDPDELTRLNEFRSKLRERGLIGSYVSHDDLAAKVRTALERDVDALVRAAPGPDESPPAAQPRAILRAKYEYDREPHTDSRGKVRMRTRRERLVIENVGTVAAEDIKISVEAIGQGEPPSLHLEGPIENVLPQASVSVPTFMHMGVAPQWRVKINWREGDEEFEVSQAVTAI